MLLSLSLAYCPLNYLSFLSLLLALNSWGLLPFSFKSNSLFLIIFNACLVHLHLGVLYILFTLFTLVNSLRWKDVLICLQLINVSIDYGVTAIYIARGAIHKVRQLFQLLLVHGVLQLDSAFRISFYVLSPLR